MRKKRGLAEQAPGNANASGEEGGVDAFGSTGVIVPALRNGSVSATAPPVTNERKGWAFRMKSWDALLQPSWHVRRVEYSLIGELIRALDPAPDGGPYYCEDAT